MHITHQQEEFSRAFVHAIASAAGFKVQPGAAPDNDSVDFALCDRGPRGRIRSPRVDVQLKSRMAPIPDRDFAFVLKAKNYMDLCPPAGEFQVPRILIVVVVPTNLNDWTTDTPESLVLRYRAFWLCLHGLPTTTNHTSVTVTIPIANAFTKQALIDMMNRVGSGALP